MLDVVRMHITHSYSDVTRFDVEQILSLRFIQMFNKHWFQTANTYSIASHLFEKIRDWLLIFMSMFVSPLLTLLVFIRRGDSIAPLDLESRIPPLYPNDLENAFIMFRLQLITFYSLTRLFVHRSAFGGFGLWTEHDHLVLTSGQVNVPMSLVGISWVGARSFHFKGRTISIYMILQGLTE